MTSIVFLDHAQRNDASALDAIACSRYRVCSGTELADAAAGVDVPAPKQKLSGYADKRQALLAHVRELERKAALADEYMAWIDCYHRGDDDYTGFLRKRLPKETASGMPGTLKENGNGCR